MDGYSTVDFVGYWKTNAQTRQRLTANLRKIEKPMVDWVLYEYFQQRFGLDPEKDNKSVWDPRSLVSGLIRYGDSVPRTLLYKYWEWAGEEAERGKIKAGKSGIPYEKRIAEGSSPWRDSEPPQAAAIGYSTLRFRLRDESDNGVVDVGRGDLATQGSGGQRGLRLGRESARVYGQAYDATFSSVGNRRRGNQVLSLAEALDKVFLDPAFSGKSAGLPSLLHRNECVDETARHAQELWDGDRPFFPYTAFHRIQHASYAANDDGADYPRWSPIKGRLVWGAPGSTTVVASAFAKPAFKNLRRRRVFAFGKGKATQGAVVLDFQARYKRVYSLDFSGFDTTIPAFIIDDAFRILATHLDMTDEQEEVYSRIVHDFIHARIVLPDASVWQKHRGIPSGNPFTSMIGSICNLLILNYVWIRLTGRALGARQVMVLGDDSIVATNSNPSLDEIADVAAELGMVVSPSKSSVATSGQRVHFLGHYWVNGRPHRDLRELVVRLVFEERHVKPSRGRRLARIYGFMAESYEAYDLGVELLNTYFRNLVPLEIMFLWLASAAGESELTLGQVGLGRYGYLESNEPELLVRNPYRNGKLAAVGMAS